MDRGDPAYRGQADYNRLLLGIYDPLVLGMLASFVWRCPARHLLEGYHRNLRGQALDVGPGSGYFLDHADIPAGTRITVLDPNPNVLRHVSKRLSRLDVVPVQADVCKPLPVGGPFESVALNLVIHCLPGPVERKTTAVANVARVLTTDGVLFGASVLGPTAPHGRIGRAMLHAYNRRGVFDNLGDSEESLRTMLAASFEDVEIATIGTIAIFTATKPRAPT